MPGWVGDFPTQHDLAAVAAHLRVTHPGGRLVCHGVPFQVLTGSLLQRRVDVLGTTQTECPGITARAAAEVPRVGVVAAAHPLADTAAVDVAQFSELPMLYGPRLPPEWMSHWSLGQVRPGGQAHLAPPASSDAAGILRHAARGAGVTVLHEPMGHALRAVLHPLTLIGAGPASCSCTSTSTSSACTCQGSWTTSCRDGSGSSTSLRRGPSARSH